MNLKTILYFILIVSVIPFYVWIYEGDKDGLYFLLVLAAIALVITIYEKTRKA